MNRRVTLVTALSVAGTAAVAAMSFAIVYEPADDPSAGVPLLDTTSATVAGDGSSTTDLPAGATPRPVSLNPAAPIVAAPVIAPPAAAPRLPDQPGRTPYATTPGSTDAAPAPTPATSPSPAAGTQPNTTAAPATTLSTPAPPPATAAPVAPAPTATTATSTTNPAPVTTVAARPEGVPADWPANKPIPPMPTGCLQPQLEDNGVWNCQH